jgi:AraC-like DNA-binding protein
MTVAALLSDPVPRQRLLSAVRGKASVRFCESQGEVRSIIEGGEATVGVVDVKDRYGDVTLNLVRGLRDDFPTVPLLLYLRMSASSSRFLLEFARAGVNDIILHDIDDVSGSIASALQTASLHCSTRQLVEELRPLVPSNVVPLLSYCIQNGRSSLTVESVASALNVHRKTLVARMSGAGLPTPSALIAWCRLLACGRALEDKGRTIEQIALMHDFPSGASLSNMVKRYTGLRTTEVRERGGLSCVLRAFKRELTETDARDAECSRAS